MSYRFPDPNPVLISLLGTESAADGTLQFYDYQTTTPKATYSDRGLTIPNANPVELDASGRAETEIWLDGEYTAVLRAADATVIWTRDIVPEVSPTTTLPDPTTLPDGTIKSNGTGYELVYVMELPDPTDAPGQMVVSNGTGTGFTLQPIEEPPTPDNPVDNTSTSVRIGTLLIQWGTGTVPAAPTAKTNSVNIVFPTAFNGTAYYVGPVNKTPGGSTSSGACAVLSSSAESDTGATITANIPDDDSNSNWKLGNATNFSYIAIGPTDD